MTNIDLTPVNPRTDTRQALAEHLSLEHGITHDDTDFGTSILHHKGNTLEPEFECPECQYSITEVYLLRYVERHSDGKRFPRNEAPTCSCAESTENGYHFSEDRRYKPAPSTAIASSHCNWCGTEYDDVFKYQTTR